MLVVCATNNGYYISNKTMCKKIKGTIINEYPQCTNCNINCKDIQFYHNSHHDGNIFDINTKYNKPINNIAIIKCINNVLSNS